MESFWRDNENWKHLNADHARVSAPALPIRPRVRMRAIGRTDGSPSFHMNGRPVEHGEIVSVHPDDVEHLIARGKAERA